MHLAAEEKGYFSCGREQVQMNSTHSRNVKSEMYKAWRGGSFLVQAEKLLLWDIFQGKSIRTESLHAGQKCGNERGAQLRAEIPTGGM